jgi:NAD(P)-dependent dehydrogenase (short-subunit alcohol dehydrogenase family)
VGRHVLVTGASGGLGLATARGLARLGAVVHLTGRDPGRLDDARSRLLTERPSAQVTVHVADVSDLAATADFARRFADEVPALHAVVHNAGVLPPQRTTTREGHELALATHVLGPHVLTYGLRASLAGGRVVLVTSGGAYGQRLDAQDPEYARGPYSGVTAYARTKRMQLVLTELWARALAADGIGVHSMHPGWAATPGVTDSLPRFAAITGPLLRDADSGADTAVWLTATTDDIGTGGFWHDRRRRPTHYAPVGVETPAEVRQLWRFVRESTGVPTATPSPGGLPGPPLGSRP